MSVNPFDNELLPDSGQIAAAHPRMQRRTKAPHRKIAAAARRLIVAKGAPMMATEIWEALSFDMQASVEQKKLYRVLRRSKRSGLLQTSGKWSVRKSWLTKADIPWERPLSGTPLAEQRQRLREACEQAINILRESATPMSVSEIREQLSDSDVDARLFRRAMWNRAKTTASIRRVGSSTYQWVCIDWEKRDAKSLPIASMANVD